MLLALILKRVKTLVSPTQTEERQDRLIQLTHPDAGLIEDRK